jgi:hypothetical protein
MTVSAIHALSVYPVENAIPIIVIIVIIIRRESNELLPLPYPFIKNTSIQHKNVITTRRPGYHLSFGHHQVPVPARLSRALRNPRGSSVYAP